jgi:alpha-L-rhamnosidase
MEKVSRIHPEGFVDARLSDHESLEPVPVELTGTLHYLQSARIMELFSKKLGYADYEKKYNKLAIQLKDKIKSKFWDNKVEGNINRQTLFSSLLYHDIISDDEINFAKDSLLKAIKNGPSGHFSTGIFGTKYILESVSKHISPQVVFDIVNSTEYPGWGYMIHRGATSIWETWKESDNVYSNSHPMFGVVTEWYYRWLGGIRPHPDFPGFKQFFLNPYTPDGLNYVRANYQSPYGKIISNWEKSDNSITYEFKIPNESLAHVSIPINKNQSVSVLKSGLNLDEIDDFQDGEFILSSGIYTINIRE